MNPTSIARSPATPGPATPRSAAPRPAPATTLDGFAHEVLPPCTPAAAASTGGIEWTAGGFGFCPSSGEWFTANDTALAVLGWQREGLTSAAIAQRLANEFDVSAAAAERDLETFFAADMGRFGAR